MTEIDKILSIANEEVGYLEKASNDQLDDKTANAGNKNYTKYARDMDDLDVYNGKKNGYAWCDIWVDWCFYKALGLDRARELLIGWSAGCTQDWYWLKNAGRITKNPQRGDLIFFGNLSHIGIIEKVENDTIYTIEGNTSNNAELVINGGCVAKKSYSINSKYIYGYARPAYDSTNDGEIIEQPSETNNEIIYSLIKKGSKGNLVRIAQEKLLAKGYRLPKWGADGNFGNETVKAVKELQRDAKIGIDGIIGNDTWGVLNSDFQKPTLTYPGYLIKKWQHSEDVRKVQQRLIDLGYSCGRWGADSIFGEGTYQAVIRFQRDKGGLSIDGIVGINTWNKLFN